MWSDILIFFLLFWSFHLLASIILSTIIVGRRPPSSSITVAAHRRATVAAHGERESSSLSPTMLWTTVVDSEMAAGKWKVVVTSYFLFLSFRLCQQQCQYTICTSINFISLYFLSFILLSIFFHFFSSCLCCDLHLWQGCSHRRCWIWCHVIEKNLLVCRTAWTIVGERNSPQIYSSCDRFHKKWKARKKVRERRRARPRPRPRRCIKVIRSNINNKFH